MVEDQAQVPDDRDDAGESDDVDPVEEAWREAIEEHCDRFLGPCPNVVAETAPDLVRIDLDPYLPAHNRERTTLVTVGVSTKETAAPEGMASYRRIELFTYLPATWSYGTDEARWWPCRTLKDVGRLVHRYSTWYAPGQLLGGDPGEPLTDDSLLTGVVLLPPVYEDPGFDQLTIEGESCRFLWAFPLTTPEIEYAQERGVSRLLELMAERDVQLPLDAKRACMITGRRPGDPPAPAAAGAAGAQHPSRPQHPSGPPQPHQSHPSGPQQPHPSGPQQQHPSHPSGPPHVSHPSGPRPQGAPQGPPPGQLQRPPVQHPSGPPAHVSHPSGPPQHVSHPSAPRPQGPPRPQPAPSGPPGGYGPPAGHPYGPPQGPYGPPPGPYGGPPGGPPPGPYGGPGTPGGGYAPAPQVPRPPAPGYRPPQGPGPYGPGPGQPPSPYGGPGPQQAQPGPQQAPPQRPGGDLWDTIVTGVEQRLERLLEVDGYLVVEEAVSGYYVQFATSRKRGTLVCEAVSNQFLPQGRRLNPEQDQRMQRLGWSRPGQGEASGSWNYARTLHVPVKVVGVARVAVATLRDVYGCEPRRLSYTGNPSWVADLKEDPAP